MAEEGKIKMTKAGYEKKLKELNKRETEIRNDISERIRYAKSQGDLSENSEYDEARDAQALNEQRIVELKKQLEDPEIIPSKRYKIYDYEDKEEQEYVLVGDTEASVLENQISMESPFGRAVVNAKVGDTVTVKINAQDGYKVKILDIIKE